MEDATENDAESVVGDEAHIVAQSGKGPRGSLIDEGNIDRYENLILLCRVHHKLIDDQPATYTVERLREMKRDHEKWAEQAIRAGSIICPHESATDSEIFDHVPLSNEEIDYVIGHRPQAWEHLMYAGLLKVGLRDARRKSEPRQPSSLVFHNNQAALGHVSALMDELKSAIKEVMDCFEPILLSKALGEPGRPGEFRLIYHIADRLFIAYSNLMDWSRSAGTAQVPRQARHLYDILSHLSDRPMRDIEEYVDRLVVELNGAAREASLGNLHPVVLKVTCAIHADERILEEVLGEMERVHQFIVRNPKR